MRTGSQIRAALVAGFLTLGLSSTAQAGASNAGLNGSGVWRFSGTCLDCGQTPQAVTARLTLTSYIQGNALTNSNFVSFTYDGSSILNPYTVPGAAPNLNFVSLVGQLEVDGPQVLALNFGTQGNFLLNLFSVNCDGDCSDLQSTQLIVEGPVQLVNWSTCVTECNTIMLSPTETFVSNDLGSDGGFVLLAQQTVPEPGTYALLAVGLGALGVAARRKRSA